MPAPDQGIALLSGYVRSLPLPAGTHNELSVKLDNALKSLRRDSRTAAVGQLIAFISSVQAQQGKKIPALQATIMISYAQEIIRLIKQPMQAAHLASATDVAFELGEVYCYPNPAKQAGPTLHVEAGIADEVEIRIYDVSGAMVHEARLTGQPQIVDGKRAYEYPWDVSHVGSGVYIGTIAAKKSGYPTLKAVCKCALVK
jgi:hypothetical protein